MGSRLRRPLHNRRAGTQLACVIVVPAQAGTQRGKGGRVLSPAQLRYPKVSLRGNDGYARGDEGKGPLPLEGSGASMSVVRGQGGLQTRPYRVKDNL